ncbi:hypothetical protein DAPK24_012500 [Pichia kluyveri]|uniref:Altered inheritance of mitochondria protein 23, mitochondrial n=1 Tax=Pichia kluyveri TaxID=36015 RepID=A0AAV5R0C9_PICKL|nr:hypothetical protein DAPK24_012500 [Pichia kluyveri]
MLSSLTRGTYARTALSLRFVRCQSSSPSAKLINNESPEQQELRLKKLQQQQQQQLQQQQKEDSQKKKLLDQSGNKNNEKVENVKSSSSSKKIKKVKTKMGFSNVVKVPSTISLETREILLDKLYQGFNPLLLPIKPVRKKAKSPKILVNIYEDLMFDEDGFENEEENISSIIGPKLEISKYIFDKNPDVENKLKELDNENKDNKSNNNIGDILFTSRKSDGSKFGRVRLQYKKNSLKTLKNRSIKSKSDDTNNNNDDDY